MPTRIVPTEELSKRLDSLDLASPVFRREEIEEHFLRFVENTHIYKKVPPIYWLLGTHDYHRHLLDLGIFGRHNYDMRYDMRNYANALSRSNFSPVRSNYQRLLPQIPQVSTDIHHNYPGLTWVLSWILHDENFLQAFEAGLGFWSLYKTAIVLFPRPRLRVREERGQQVLHSLLGPAVQFPDDLTSNQYWIRGVRVPEFAVMHPERITRAHIRAVRSPAVRRTLIDQYGLLKWGLERGYKQVDHNDSFGATLYARGGNPTRWGMGGLTLRECIVELVNSTPEPDGTHQHFARRVPGTMQTAHEAVAWTFGFTQPQDYHPAVQT
jgi:hypothetical protein